MANDLPVAAILLAGGTGSRMDSSLPKQFMPLGTKRVIHYSLEAFSNLSNIKQIVVVSAPEYRSYILDGYSGMPIDFAMPGERRQDSLANGIGVVDKDIILLCIHDAARPFVTAAMAKKVIEAATESGAAVAAMPCVNTIKQASSDSFVEKTIDRATLWEMQTPQVLHKEIAIEGLRLAEEKGISVTDDVALAELLYRPVKIVMGAAENIKITRPIDLHIAKAIMMQHQESLPPMLAQ